jgi:hypothetical protein
MYRCVYACLKCQTNFITVNVMFKSVIYHLRKTLTKDPALLVLLVMAATYFLLYYITDPTLPGDVYFNEKSVKSSVGWFGFWDQSQYIRIARDLAHFNFGDLHQAYTYGLGYPLVAVPFIWLGLASDPFVIFNFSAFLLVIFAVYKTAKKLISPSAGWLAGFGLVFATPLIQYVITPWNSTVCLLTISVILLTAISNKVTKWHAFILGFVVGWSFAARYVDILWLGLLALACLYRGSLKALAKQTVFVLLGLCLWVIPVLYSHNVYFGSPFKTPYANHIGLGGIGGSDQGLNAYKLSNVPDAALGMFISPKIAGSPDIDRGWLINMFWVLAAIPGAFILMKRGDKRLFWGTLVVVTVVAFVFYLSFRASTSSSIKYGVLHYFKMFWPGLVLLAAAFFDYLFRFSSRKH